MRPKLINIVAISSKHPPLHNDLKTFDYATSISVLNKKLMEVSMIKDRPVYLFLTCHAESVIFIGDKFITLSDLCRRIKLLCPNVSALIVASCNGQMFDYVDSDFDIVVDAGVNSDKQSRRAVKELGGLIVSGVPLRVAVTLESSRSFYILPNPQSEINATCPKVLTTATAFLAILLI